MIGQADFNELAYITGELAKLTAVVLLRGVAGAPVENADDDDDLKNMARHAVDMSHRADKLQRGPRPRGQRADEVRAR